MNAFDIFLMSPVTDRAYIRKTKYPNGYKKPSGQPGVIIAAVCEYYDISKELLMSKTRVRKVTQARYISFKFIKELTTFTLDDIGLFLTNPGENRPFDHSTVIYGINHIGDLIETDRKVSIDYERLKVKIRHAC